MSAVQDQHVGVVDEVTYGTPVLVTRFFEYISSSISGKYDRVEGEGQRSGSRLLRSDRFMPTAKGAEGDLKLEVLDKTFGFWLKHMLGQVATTGVGPYVHTGTVADLRGKYFTLQQAVCADDGTLFPFTYQGGKVKSFELSNSVDQVLQLSLSLDFQKENAGSGAGALALATPTYVAGSALLTFLGGAVTVGGASFAVSDISIKGDNSLKTDRWFLGNTKKEPLEENMREYTFELKGEFNNLTQYNRVLSVTAAGAVAGIVATWTSPTAGSTLVATIPAARFDEAPVVPDGAKIVEQTLTGKILFDGTASPLTLAYTTADVSP